MLGPDLESLNRRIFTNLIKELSKGNIYSRVFEQSLSLTKVVLKISRHKHKRFLMKCSEIFRFYDIKVEYRLKRYPSVLCVKEFIKARCI